MIHMHWPFTSYASHIGEYSCLLAIVLVKRFDIRQNPKAANEKGAAFP
jgi:hypothetical protein